jgi:hypothetical protein
MTTKQRNMTVVAMKGWMHGKRVVIVVAAVYKLDPPLLLHPSTRSTCRYKAIFAKAAE